MTKNKAQKAAARRHQAATGKPYTLARREAVDPTDVEPVLCSTIVNSLHEQLSRVGWAGAEPRPLLDSLSGQWDMWFGPVHVEVRRDTDSFADSGDPDDERLIHEALPVVVAMFPGIESIEMSGTPTEYGGLIERTFTDHGYNDAVMAGDMESAGMADQIRSVVAEGRSRGLAAYTTDRECTVCNRRLAYRHFIRIDHHWLCPYCVFDQDVDGTLHPGRFALIYDELFLRDSTIPHQWGAFAAMFAWANQQTGGTREGLLLDPGSRHPLAPILLEHWDDPLDTWVWVPQSDRLPRPVSDLGTGARLGYVIEAWGRACPDLQARFIRSVLAEWTGEFDRTAEDRKDFEEHVKRIWPVLMAAMICVAVPDRLSGDFDDEWVDQFADSHHAEVLEDHFGLPQALTGSVANPFDYLSNLADLAAPEVSRF